MSPDVLPDGISSDERDILEEFGLGFKALKGMGFIDSRRFHDTGIGKTAEDLLGIVENNKTSADYKGLIELKSHRELSEAMVTLFTKSPEPRGANTVIRESYGYPDEKFKDKKVLHITFSARQFSSSEKSKYGFMLDVNRSKQKIFIKARHILSGKIETSEVFYPFDKLRANVEHKCKYIIFISAEKRREGRKELFHFTKAKLLSGLTFDKFLQLVEEGLIKYDFRLGVYKTGKMIGKYHDHGSGFRFNTNNLENIFTVTELT